MECCNLHILDIYGIKEWPYVGSERLEWNKMVAQVISCQRFYAAQLQEMVLWNISD